MTFKEKLVKLRKRSGITQEEFAKAVGVSRQAVYKWECGQSYPEVAKLIEIKALFNISIDDLLDDNYEVVLPEKTKRRRNAKKAEAPVNTEETAPIAEETKTEEITEEAPVEQKAEEPVTEEAVATEEKEVVTEPEEKKEETRRRGFFSRIFRS